MYAIIDSGGHQYKVHQGDSLRVEKLSAAEGELLNIDRVRMLVDGSDVRVGAPYIAGASVAARLVAHGRGSKVRVIKMKRRKYYRKSSGHRQHFSELVIESIQGA